MAKLTENSFRDVNIAFANELAGVCDEIGVDVWEVIKLANHHPRVNILNPGPGVGGHCIAVDPWFIVSAAPEQATLIRTARQVNDARPGAVVEAVVEVMESESNSIVACLGLAFKANIDDLRESPALAITQQLAARLPDATILAVEPHVASLPPSLADFENVQLTDPELAMAKADTVVLLVDHNQFKDIDQTLLAGKTVIDTRGVWR
jgi:UDP-N-acetyl-D-mannosaminuronic acid dehydrogenase